MDYGVIWERDRQPTITVRSETAPGRLGIDVTHSVDARLTSLRATLPIGRVVGPADVAALAIQLMTNTAVTGATYDIDGGQQLVAN